MGKFVGVLQQKCGPRPLAMYLLGSGVHDSTSKLDIPESTVVCDASPGSRSAPDPSCSVHPYLERVQHSPSIMSAAINVLPSGPLSSTHRPCSRGVCTVRRS